MNRIYQGQVTAVEILDGNEPKPFDADPQRAKEKWPAALWQHHQLFQDAVNYYTLALAAMAGGCVNPTFQEAWVKAAVGKAEADPETKEKDRPKCVADLVVTARGSYVVSKIQ